MSKNYVDNKELYDAICKWKEECELAGHTVKASDYIGNAIVSIAKGASGYWKFSRYTSSWKEEMIGDAIETTIKYLPNFDVTKYKNPHAYISMICFNAFVQRIKKEKADIAKKHAYFIHHVYDSKDTDMAELADETFIQDIYDKMQQYEQSLAAKKPEKKPSDELELANLDFLYGEET